MTNRIGSLESMTEEMYKGLINIRSMFDNDYGIVRKDGQDIGTFEMLEMAKIWQPVFAVMGDYEDFKENK